MGRRKTVEVGHRVARSEQGTADIRVTLSIMWTMLAMTVGILVVPDAGAIAEEARVASGCVVTGFCLAGIGRIMTRMRHDERRLVACCDDCDKAKTCRQERIGDECMVRWEWREVVEGGRDWLGAVGLALVVAGLAGLGIGWLGAAGGVVPTAVGVGAVGTLVAVIRVRQSEGHPAQVSGQGWGP